MSQYLDWNQGRTGYGKLQVCHARWQFLPIPMTGIFTAFAACSTREQGDWFNGRTDKPPYPAPIFAAAATWVASIARAMKVLTSEIASAPFCSATRANGSMGRVFRGEFDNNWLLGHTFHAAGEIRQGCAIYPKRGHRALCSGTRRSVHGRRHIRRR